MDRRKMTSKSASLKKDISDIVLGLGYECVGVDCHSGRSSTVLRVFIDSPEGIKHHDCERVSRAISEYADLTESCGENIFQGKYFIEVSSPGIERPLYTEEHYARFVGSKVSLSAKGYGKIKGIVLSCEHGTVSLRTVEGEEISLPFGDIKKGNIAF
jgi:ribosome maturation factor RimP